MIFFGLSFFTGGAACLLGVISMKLVTRLRSVEGWGVVSSFVVTVHYLRSGVFLILLGLLERTLADY